MSFTYIAEVLNNPHHQFKLEEKQLAINAVLVFFWKDWDYVVSVFEETKDVESLYKIAFQRDKATDILLKTEIGLFGKTS